MAHVYYGIDRQRKEIVRVTHEGDYLSTGTQGTDYRAVLFDKSRGVKSEIMIKFNLIELIDSPLRFEQLASFKQELEALRQKLSTM